jgi:hypothetical protein
MSYETLLITLFLYCVFFFRWVSNGVVGSPAFAAYDQGSSLKFFIFQSFINSHTATIYQLLTLFSFTGYDVFLGNFRGLVSRDHVNKNISSKE